MYTLPPSKKVCFTLLTTAQQPTLPQGHLFNTRPAMIIYNVPDSNGLAGEQMDLQVYTIRIYRINEREGNRNYPKWGFDQEGLNLV